MGIEPEPEQYYLSGVAQDQHPLPLGSGLGSGPVPSPCVLLSHGFTAATYV